ncbi:hypothetical protein [Aurantiacibacter sp. D1-12]|uniref:hypothetical protein n=1 Tax=Aurantiacibacter sp. D1-12 TaxID=2993658 RepID=UPI00237C805A|nr:hypothetical protein [Aurantiacibacter sp. D1-12]MDE1466140.1 hypothetical protein [Aurantiacibacter sp. D1-12]
MIRTLSTAAIALAIPCSALAQDEPGEATRMQMAQDAQATAQLMAEVQQAVGIAQIQYSGMTGQLPDAAYRGAVALPGSEEGVWDTVIIGSLGGALDAQLVALAEYEISGGQIVSEVIHLPGQTPLIDGQVAAMAEARAIAPRAILAAGNNVFCADDSEGAGGTPSVTFATIVLPPREDGSFDAYVLNGPIEEGAIPLGKHFLVSFDAFGLSGEPLLVTDTCEVITWDADNPDLAMSVYVTEYDGPAPTPVHAFVSSLLPMSMGVVTGDIIWPMADGEIAAPVPAAEAGYAPAE